MVLTPEVSADGLIEVPREKASGERINLGHLLGTQ